MGLAGYERSLTPDFPWSWTLRRVFPVVWNLQMCDETDRSCHGAVVINLCHIFPRNVVEAWTFGQIFVIYHVLGYCDMICGFDAVWQAVNYCYIIGINRYPIGFWVLVFFAQTTTSSPPQPTWSHHTPLSIICNPFGITGQEMNLCWWCLRWHGFAPNLIQGSNEKNVEFELVFFLLISPIHCIAPYTT